MTKEFECLTLLISKLQVEQDEVPFEDYIKVEDEHNIEVEYHMLDLVDLA